MTRAAENTGAAQRSTIAAWVVALVVFGYTSFLTSRSTLFDRDEPRFAQATVEMIASGDWLVPTFDGELRADKPVLVYWLMSIPMRVVGASAWTARFWSPACLAGACLVLFFAARRFFDARAGLLAMGFLAFAPLALMEGTVATTDSVLLVSITVALATLAHALCDGPRVSQFVVLALALAAGLLAKGPVGLAVPLLSIATALWMTRRTGVLGARYVKGLVVATIAGVGAFLAWAIPANAATGGEFARRGLGHHVVERIATPLESHGGGFLVSLPFYVPVVALGFLTGIAYLPAAFTALWSGTLGDARARALLVAWIAPCFVLMTLVSTKLPHYVLPIWPGLALASAAVVGLAERNELAGRERRALAFGAWILALIAGLLVVACAGFALAGQLDVAVLEHGLKPGAIALVKLEGLSRAALVFALLLATTTIVALREHACGRVRNGAIAFVAGSAIAWLSACVLALPVIERTKVSPRIADAIHACSANGVPVARWKFVEPSLDFCVGRPPIRDFEDADALHAWAAESGPALLVIPRDALLDVRAWFPDSRYREIYAAAGFNLSKGKPLELVLLGRDLPAEVRR